MFESLDIIILAAIAGFVIFKLYNLLGQSDHEYIIKDPQGKKIIDILPIEITDITAAASKNKKRSLNFASEIDSVIVQIKMINNDFDPENFIEIATKAFEIIIAAYSSNDLVLLKKLLNKEVFDAFSREINSRKDKGEVLEKTLISIASAEIVAASLVKQNASISIKFSSQQVNLIKNNDGKVIKGRPDEIDEIKEIWTFAHNLGNSDPTWKLISTAAA